jgi:hydrogenase maturation factor
MNKLIESVHSLFNRESKKENKNPSKEYLLAMDYIHNSNEEITWGPVTRGGGLIHIGNISAGEWQVLHKGTPIKTITEEEATDIYNLCIYYKSLADKAESNKVLKEFHKEISKGGDK